VRTRDLSFVECGDPGRLEIFRRSIVYDRESETRRSAPGSARSDFGYPVDGSDFVMPGITMPPDDGNRISIAERCGIVDPAGSLRGRE